MAPPNTHNIMIVQAPFVSAIHVMCFCRHDPNKGPMGYTLWMEHRPPREA